MGPGTPTPVKNAAERKRGQRRRNLFWVIAGFIVAIVGTFFLGNALPFTQSRVIEKLQEASDSRVTVLSFRRRYFPYPGCILSGVSFVHGKHSRKPLTTAEKVTIRSRFFGILTGHIQQVTAEGVRVYLPPFGAGEPFHTSPSKLTVDAIVVNGAIAEFPLREQEKQTLEFAIRRASFFHVKPGTPMKYSLDVHNPEPPGEVIAQGSYGPWNESDPAQTEISGEYRFNNANLHVYGGIAGILSAAGRFSGALGHLNITGTTDVPNFEVTAGGHPVHLTTQFSAYVNGINGDTFLERVEAHLRNTHVVADGSIVKSEGSGGKTAHLRLSVTNGHIEDLLGLFVTAERPPMSGVASLRANVEIPPGQPTFLERVKLDGTFGIGRGEFAKPSTQGSVNKLSAGALGEKQGSDPETALTDLAGDVSLETGVARFTGLSFRVPGATARMHGTYNIINHKIDLHGQMALHSKISKTTNGAKALLLRMIDPIFKKHKKDEILPVQITGTYEKPSFGLDLMDKKAQIAAPAHSSEPSR